VTDFAKVTRDELLAEIDRLVRVEKAARAVIHTMRSLRFEDGALPPALVAQLTHLQQQLDGKPPLPPEWGPPQP
jgi:hypothetical protein